MKSNPFISSTEHRKLKVIALLIFILTLINLSLLEIEQLSRPAIDFTISGFYRPNFVYEFRFFAIILFPFIFWAKKYIFPTLIAIFSFASFVYENYLSITTGYFANNAPMPFLEFVGYIAKPLDYFVFLLVSILLIWQISILWRISFVNSQMKVGLK